MPERGWYLDPADDGKERFWDGDAWTVTTRPAGSGTAPPAPPSPPAQPDQATATPAHEPPSGWDPGPWPTAPGPTFGVDPHPGPVVAYPPPPPPPPTAGDRSGMQRCSRTRRALAGLIDRAVVMGPLFVAWVVVVLARNATGTGQEVVALFLLAALVWTPVAGFVDLVVLQGRSGQSLGKRLLRIRLVGDRDGRPLGVGRALVRGLVSIGFGLVTCGVGSALDHLWPLWSADGKRIVDKWRGCTVVDAGPEPPPASSSEHVTSPGTVTSPGEPATRTLP